MSTAVATDIPRLKARYHDEIKAKLQEELGERTVETASGGGMVTVVANGKQQVVSIRIEKEVVDPEDVERAARFKSFRAFFEPKEGKALRRDARKPGDQAAVPAEDGLS
mgnify:CR=1 FL=1